MAKYKVTYKRSGCIGAFQCTSIFSKYWKVADDGKADLVGGKKTNGDFEIKISEKDLPRMKEAAAACPVNVIHIKDENGKKMV